MGLFSESLNKMHKTDREARFKEKAAMMKRNGVTLRDIDLGKWMIVEEGAFGQTVVKLYKLVETVDIGIEEKVRAVVKIVPSE